MILDLSVLDTKEKNPIIFSLRSFALCYPYTAGLEAGWCKDTVLKKNKVSQFVAS